MTTLRLGEWEFRRIDDLATTIDLRILDRHLYKGVSLGAPGRYVAFRMIEFPEDCQHARPGIYVKGYVRDSRKTLRLPRYENPFESRRGGTRPALTGWYRAVRSADTEAG